MKRENPPEAMCHGKPRFDTLAGARKAARRLNRNHNANARGYHCRHCHGFHVGTSVGGKGKHRRPRYEQMEEA